VVISKPVRVLVAIAAFIAGAFVTRQAIDWLRREPAVSGKVVQQPWVTQSFDSSDYVFEVPWPLQPTSLDFPPAAARAMASSTVLTHGADGMNIMAMHIALLPGTSGNLEGAADGSINNMRTVPGTVSVDGNKHATTVLGQPAFDVQARIQRERGGPLQLYAVVFGQGSDLYQVQFIAAADQSAAQASWKRLRDSFRMRGAKS
jgi:hypothetical protein